MDKKKKRTKRFQKENYDWKDEDKHIFEFAYRICRYCKKPGNLITPCYCEGKNKYEHYDCLKKSIIIGDRERCEWCNYTYQVTEKRRALKYWSLRNVAKHDLRKLRKNILMLFIAIGTMVGAALLTAQTYLEGYKKEGESDKKHKETLYGKVSIMIFLMLGTVAFAGLQMIWYRKFYRKLIRSNRDIDVEIEPDLRRRSYLSVIDEESPDHDSKTLHNAHSMQSININSLKRSARDSRHASGYRRQSSSNRLEDALMRESSPTPLMTSRDCTIFYQPKLQEGYMYMN